MQLSNAVTFAPGLRSAGARTVYMDTLVGTPKSTSTVRFSRMVRDVAASRSCRSSGTWPSSIAYSPRVLVLTLGKSASCGRVVSCSNVRVLEGRLGLVALSCTRPPAMNTFSSPSAAGTTSNVYRSREPGMGCVCRFCSAPPCTVTLLAPKPCTSSDSSRVTGITASLVNAWMLLDSVTAGCVESNRKLMVPDAGLAFPAESRITDDGRLTETTSSALGVISRS